jgi:hypothetical protein
MLKRLTALFAILVLLLPGSLAAVALDSTEVCLGAGLTPGCCCRPHGTSRLPGPHLQRGCCCSFDAPTPMPDTPDQERAETGTDVDPNPAVAVASISFQPVHVAEAAPPRFAVHLRAPPAALFLKYSRFLC